ncbi:cation/H(+) antiporter 1-like [Raphanus sativus]|uniref:Cation/H(+) antiporter 1-like n=1 Tax=Raphanus sativus TaxID=3726 RepID=A0A6J0MEB8_RAPSA|nr:cation/H(+) antiporter 1-like [Raphanus sativus]
MDPKMLFCLPEGDALFNPLNTMFIQMACILVFSQFFYLFLKPCGQAGPVAQILAGIVLSLLTIIQKVHDFFLQKDSASYYIFFSFLLRTCFMFLIGLELDLDFMKRNLKNSIVITLGSLVSCAIIWIPFLWFLVRFLHIKGDFITLYVAFLVTLSNTASPVVIRSIIDWKLHTSEVGRLAISCGLFIEITNIFIYTMVIAYISGKMTGDIFAYTFATLVIILINRFLASWLPKRNPKEKYLSKAETLAFFILILIIALTIESSNINSTGFVFLIGLTFPREGKTYRTLINRLSYPIHEFVLPVYFGYIGFRFSVHSLTKRHYLALVMTVALSMVAKLLGVLCACLFLKIPKKYWLFLSTILSVKGHIGLVLLDSNLTYKKWFTPIIHDTFIATLVITTLLSGVISSLLLKSQEKGFSHQKTSLEFHDTNEELRVLSCVYGVRQARGLISLVSALNGVSSSPFTPYLMHLIPLSKKRKTELLYHELDEDGLNSIGGDDEFGTNEGLEINDSIDSFTRDRKVMIRQVKLVALMENMHEEICNGSEDLRVSIVFLPFHKHQRIDGKTTNDGEAFRDMNRKVLKQAQCSIGIFVDRNITGFRQLHGFESVQHVAALFFGGPDDREALSLCQWLINNAQIHLTIIQFVADGSETGNLVGDAVTRENNDVLMEIVGNDQTNGETDRTFLEEYYNRYVTTGQVGFIEKRVSNGEQTLTILREIGEMYSLFVVGKNRGDCLMTSGMNDWEECPELGNVGDFLASSNMDVNASVLVVQRHRHSFDIFGDE